MLKISIPQSKSVLFEAVLEPTGSGIDKLQKDISEGRISTFLGKENKVSVGIPYYENLVSRLIEEKEEIPHEIKIMMKDYDFHFVSLSCSFLPDSSCKFVWAKFGIELGAVSKSGELIEEKPIAYDMIPNEVLSTITCRSEVNLGPELKASLGIVDVDITSKVGESGEFIVYEPEMFAFGINSSSVAWIFKSTKVKGIWGNKRGLNLTIKAPKGSKVKGRFLLGAEVESYIAGWIRIPFAKGKKDKAVDAEYNLSE